MAPEKITLVIPANNVHARTVRMTAATIASEANMTFAEVEDVRIAAEEAFVYAVATHAGVGEVAVAFSVDRGELVMEFSLGRASVLEEEGDPARAYAAFILEGVSDECEITDGEEPLLRVVKRAEEANADG